MAEVDFRGLCIDLATIKRRGWLARGIPVDDCESVADHSHAVAMYCKLYAPDEYRDKAISIALVHDLGEVVVGDIIPADGVSKERKLLLEELAFTYFASTNPAAEHWAKSWREYEENATEAAQFVHDVDKLQRLDKAAKYARRYPQCDLSDFKQDGIAIRHPILKHEAEVLLSRWKDWEGHPTRKYVFVTGGPGVGKGTQCALAAKKLDALHLSAGELLRSEQATPGSPYQEFITKSFLHNVPVPASLIINLMSASINKQPKSLIILDGFPLTKEQLDHFENEVWPTIISLSGTSDSLIQISRSYAIVYMHTSQETLTKRLQDRAKKSGRADDTASQIEKRIDSFQARQNTIFSLMGARGHSITRVDSGGSVDDVQELFLRAIEEKQ
ncbi:hypothetical protein QQS21_002561 [Conoideocrella luteorostrata]|uniref:5'-deoxynucleotidase n=1 Tax=Conoideocrella luteorostrata TaxID=1105319 RepID=A0AAJ0CXV8_9HYPO|nr:hypothetical protein QQS21_002561 [Conoideocrella luteorostrata]